MMKNLKIKTKVLLLGTVIGLLTIAIAIVAMISIRMLSNDLRQTSRTLDFLSQLSYAYLSYGQMMIQARDLPIYLEQQVDAASGATPVDEIDDGSDHHLSYAELNMNYYTEAIEKCLAILEMSKVPYDEINAVFQEIEKENAIVLPMVRDCIHISESGDVARASKFMFEKIKPQSTHLAKLMGDLAILCQTGEKELYEKAQKNARWSNYIIIAAFIIGWLLIAPFLYRIMQYIVQPITVLSHNMRRLADGDFDIIIAAEGHDEIADLLHGVNSVVATLHTLNARIATMADEHSIHGNYQARIDTSEFRGEYKLIVEGINEMMSCTVKDVLDILGAFSAFAAGDFSAELRVFTGDKKLGNEVFDKFKENLETVYVQIRSLINKAADGELEARASAASFSGDWVQLVDALNRLMNAIVTPVDEALLVLEQIAKGNFSARMNGDYRGDFGTIRDSVNKTAMGIASYLNDKVEAEHQATMALIARDHATSLMNARTQFLSNMSHEIRTPLNAIIGMAELLENDVLSQKQERYVNDIRTSGKNLLGLINNILDLSKIDSGKFQILPVDYDLWALLNNIDSIFAFTAHSKEIGYITEKSSDLPQCVFGDDVRVRQILNNLLGNAIKFTITGYVKLKTWAENDNLCFDITDTGQGIHKQDIDKLFVAFEQVDKGANRTKQGTGLGLVITKNLIEAMEGSISIESEYGKGTVFHVRLPLVVGDIANIKTVRDDTTYLSAPEANILVVDDFDVNLHVATGMLDLYGIKCDTANSGAIAIQMVQEKAYDIVFMDHMMPEMDGIETTKRIRNLPGFAKDEFVVIALTANAIQGVREIMLESGMDDFLTKPIDKLLLSDMLQRWLPPHKVHIKSKFAQIHPPVAEETNTPIAIFGTLQGIEIDCALRLMGGSERMLADTIKIIVKTLPEMIQVMQSNLAANNLHRFAIEIHGCKSSMATIGANTLSQQALMLEMSAKEGDAQYCNTHFPPFLAELTALNATLADIFLPREDTEKPQGDLAQLPMTIEGIEQNLAAFDDDTILDTLETLCKSSFTPQIDEKLAALQQQVELFQYTEANLTVAELRELL